MNNQLHVYMPSTKITWLAEDACFRVWIDSKDIQPYYIPKTNMTMEKHSQKQPFEMAYIWGVVLTT